METRPTPLRLTRPRTVVVGRDALDSRDLAQLDRMHRLKLNQLAAPIDFAEAVDGEHGRAYQIWAVEDGSVARFQAWFTKGREAGFFRTGTATIVNYTVHGSLVLDEAELRPRAFIHDCAGAACWACGFAQ